MRRPSKDDFRGLSAGDEQQPRYHLRDYRRPLRRLHDALERPQGLAAGLLAIGLGTAVFPLLFYGFLAATLALLLVYRPRAARAHLPARLPVEADQTDYNDPKPGRTGFNHARGIFHYGNSIDPETYHQQINLSADDLLTHEALFGTTGAGKTEALLSKVWNVMTMGSGVVFVDPKGTNELPLKVETLARMVGRDDDVLRIVYSTGNRTIAKHAYKRRSNTSNPFAHGTADFLSDIMNSLVPSSEGENAVFSERALSLMKTIMIGLVEMRDQGRLNLSVKTIREWMTMEGCITIMDDPMLSTLARDAMRAYLESVPGFIVGKEASQQGEDAHKQFGFAQAYFTRALSSLTDSYGHVYGALTGEVDYQDVVFNRRILTVILPSMEKAPAELKSLAKVVLTAIRSALSMGLGSDFEGDYETMRESLPASSNLPSLYLLDEYGYIATEGMAVTAAQARGLGAAFVFAGQDYAGWKRASEVEAESVIANTKVKTFMALEDPKETWDIVKTVAGEAQITVTSGYSIRDDQSMDEYNDSRQTNVQSRSRVDLLDLRAQIEGEFHMFHKSQLIRGAVFYVDPPIKNQPAYINRFVSVDRPDPQEVSKRYGAIRDLTEALKAWIETAANASSTARPTSPAGLDENDPLNRMVNGLRAPAVQGRITPRELGLAGLVEAFNALPAPPTPAATPPEAPGDEETAASDPPSGPPDENDEPEAPFPGETDTPSLSDFAPPVTDEPDEPSEPDAGDEGFGTADPPPNSAPPPSMLDSEDRVHRYQQKPPSVDKPPSSAQGVQGGIERAVATGVRLGIPRSEGRQDMEERLNGGATQYPQAPTPTQGERQIEAVRSTINALRASSDKYARDKKE